MKKLILIAAMAFLLMPNVFAATECPGIARIIWPEHLTDFNTSDFHVYVEFNAEWVREHSYTRQVGDGYEYSYVYLNMWQYTDEEGDRCIGGNLEMIDEGRTRVDPPQDDLAETFTYARAYSHYEGYNPSTGCWRTGEHKIYLRIEVDSGISGQPTSTTEICTMYIEFNAHAPELNAIVTFYEPANSAYSYLSGESGVEVPVRADLNIIQSSAGQVCLFLEEQQNDTWTAKENLGCYDASQTGHPTSPDTDPYSWDTSQLLAAGTYRYVVYWTADGTYNQRQALIGAKAFTVTEFTPPPPTCGFPIIDYPKDGEHYILGSVPFRVIISDDDDLTYYEYRAKFYKREGLFWTYKDYIPISSHGTFSQTLGHPIDSEGYWKIEMVKCLVGSSSTCTDVCNSVEFYVDPYMEINYNWVEPCDGCTYEYNEGSVPIIPLIASGEYNISSGHLCFATGVYNNGWQYTVEADIPTNGAGSFSVDQNLSAVTGEGSYRIRFYYAQSSCDTPDNIIEERSFRVVKYVPPPEQNEMNRISPEMPWGTVQQIALPPSMGAGSKSQLTPYTFVNVETIWYIIGMLLSAPFWLIHPGVGAGVFAMWNYAGWAGEPRVVFHLEMIVLPLLVSMLFVARYLYEISIGGGGGK